MTKLFSRSFYRLACVAMLLTAACGGSKSSTKTAKTAGAEGAGTDQFGEPIAQETKRVELSAETEGQWVRALAAFDKAEKAGWNSAACGDVGGQFVSAAKAHKGGGLAEAWYMAGLVRDRCDDRSGALDYYKKALDTNANLCEARAALGVNEYLQGNTSEAYAMFKRALQTDAQCTAAYVNLAAFQARTGTDEERKEALNNLRRALAVDAETLPAFNQMALIYLRRGEGGQALPLSLGEVVCQQAKQIDDKYASIYNTWGLINLEQGKIVPALAKFERASALDPKLFEAHMNFGRLTLAFRGYEDAKRAFSKAVELQPKNYEARLALGVAERGLKNLEVAKKHYTEAVDLDGGRPEAYFNLGVLYQDYMSGSAQDLAEARKYFQEFLSRASSKPGYAEVSKELQKRCSDARPAKGKRRRHRGEQEVCVPGRLQNIEIALDALRAANAAGAGAS